MLKTAERLLRRMGFGYTATMTGVRVATASRFVGDDLKDQSQPVSDLERVYRFDPIGNRIHAVEGKDEIQYQANSLNQYERILAPPQKEEALSYDEDGNLIGGWSVPIFLE